MVRVAVTRIQRDDLGGEERVFRRGKERGRVFRREREERVFRGEREERKGV